MVDGTRQIVVRNIQEVQAAGDSLHQLIERAVETIAAQREMGQVAQGLQLGREASPQGVVAHRQHLQGGAAGDGGRKRTFKSIGGEIELPEVGSADGCGKVSTQPDLINKKKVVPSSLKALT